MADGSPMELPDLFRESRHDFEEIPHDPVVGNLEDRRVLVLVDGHNDLRRAHAGEVLDRARDADSDVERGAHRLAGLAHLVRVWPPSPSTTAREAPTAARPPNDAASASSTLKLAGSFRPRPPELPIGASPTS